jgi:hypothetical protein
MNTHTPLSRTHTSSDNSMIWGTRIHGISGSIRV